MAVRHEHNWELLLETIPTEMQKRAIPGLAVGILVHGQVKAAGFGVTNVEHPLPVSAETLFQIGSITKTFTATALMRLVEMGKLDLDEPLQTYLPNFKVADATASAQATTRHLLTHTGGWFGDHFHDSGSGEDALANYMADMAELEQLVPLGTVWSYSNAGFYLAGYLIEVVTGKSYQTALTELVLEPLGLQQCYFEAEKLITHRFVVGHNVVDGEPQVARPWALPRAVQPVGGIICSVRELLRYAQFHLGDGTGVTGERVISAETLTQMQATHVPVWKNETFGLSWFLNKLNGTQLIYHGGGTKGQVTRLTLIPEHKMAIAVFTNAEQGGAVTRAVTNQALKQYLALDTPQPRPIIATPEELANYTGYFYNPYADLELNMLCGQLVGQLIYKRGFPSKEIPPSSPPPPAAFTLCEQDRLLVLNGATKGETIDVIRQQDGSILGLRQGGRLRKRRHKNSY
ncbi:MAG TPA: class A beta-lactamase-related serine hydrolase [Anaerolineae bacterium]|nr:class A beta-lactamase-related serine hydrolase [Anaerolineae bacterium]